MLIIFKGVFPSHEQWETVIAGMRNPKNSWEKSDTEYDWDYEQIKIGPNDLRLMKILCTSGNPELKRMEQLSDSVLFKDSPDYDEFMELMDKASKKGSSEHAKFLRQLPVTIEIRGPLYWWKQMDQYKVGTVTDSCSTMHKLTDKPFEIGNFNGDHIPKSVLEDVVKTLNEYRDKYLETKDMKYWHAINELLPQSYFQMRTWSGNYEVLRTICRQREGHKLPEWRQFIYWVYTNVPYAPELIFGDWD